MATAKEYSVEEKLSSLLNLQKVESKLDEISILKGELPIEVADLEDEILGLHARETRIEEEINGINEFVEQKKQLIATSSDLVSKYEKQSDNVKNNREYEAITKELEMQTLEVKLAERHIKDANEEISDKARILDAAKKNIIEFEFDGKTIPHEITVDWHGARVMMKPAPEGTGVIAGSKVRAVLELGGVKNVVAKNLGSNNPLNQVGAAIKALLSLRNRGQTLANRGLA
jgi:predicted  nucleic acid-binding Zn-ribbon protein